MIKEAYICDAIRTPFGKYGGALSSIRTDDLAAIPIAALLAKRKYLADAVEDIYLGCANQAGEDNRNVARMAGLLSGMPVQVGGVTINRLCGSGMDSVCMASNAIRAGSVDLVVAGGVESMSRAPYVIGKSTKGFDRDQKMYDTTLGWRFVNPKMEKRFGVASMIQTGENVAEKWGISREEQDLFAYNSQLRAYEAQRSGFFDSEICEVTCMSKKETLTCRLDEQVRLPKLESLSLLSSILPAGTITAGNSSSLNDGACAMIVASDVAVRSFGLVAQARIVGVAACGVLPEFMGIGPVPAIEKVLDKSGMSLASMDVIEINEAFAAQVLAVMKALHLRPDDPRVNPNGGAISLGHPLGASGSRLVMTAINQLHRSGGRFALCAMCVGVGQGIAIIVEKTY